MMPGSNPAAICFWSHQRTATATANKSHFMVAAAATTTTAEVYLWRVVVVVLLLLWWVVVVGWRAIIKVSQSIDQDPAHDCGSTHCLRRARQVGGARGGVARRGDAAVVVLLAVCLFAVQSVLVLQVRGRCKGEGAVAVLQTLIC
jgi:hypothetical protein